MNRSSSYLRLGWLGTCIAAVVLSLLPSVLHANDLLPPSWRGEPGTTYQQWRFDSHSFVSPEVAVNPYGNPWADTTGGYAVPDNTGRQGVLILNFAHMLASVPIAPAGSAGGYAYVQFQITYLDFKSQVPNWESDNGRPGIYAKYSSPMDPYDFTSTPPGDLIDEQDVVLESGLALTGETYNWRLWRSLWRVQPVTPTMTFAIGRQLTPGGSNEVNLDDVVIDTKLVPEPSSFVALASLMTGFAAVIRRRRS